MPALATTSIAWVLLAIMVVGWIVYAALNAGAARRELGSEIELAANRKPYSTTRSSRVGGSSSCSRQRDACS